MNLTQEERIARLDAAERLSVMGCLYDGRDVDDLLDRIEAKKAKDATEGKRTDRKENER